MSPPADLKMDPSSAFLASDSSRSGVRLSQPAVSRTEGRQRVLKIELVKCWGRGGGRNCFMFTRADVMFGLAPSLTLTTVLGREGAAAVCVCV